jgi:paired amphipathic helix protein Sin3a
VKDALSYLDQVKVQFQGRPDIYNHFLDIMKDFKSQAIDTPGVIDRVSTLFRGRPALIQGFNTFLPPGYRIECSLDPSDPNPIRVTTPMGTTTRQESNANVVPEPQRWGSQNGALGQQGQPAQPQQLGSIHQAPLHDQHGQYGQTDQQSSMSHLQAAAANRGSSVAERKSGGPVEFNHAINYVNKIKTRFANQPDIYKHFLEILQTYQREQKPIAEVYQQVTILFQNAPDLLEDFKQFLPDPDANPTGAFFGGQHQAEYYQQAGQLPPVGNFSPPVAGKVKKFEVTNDQMVNYDVSKYTNREIQTSNLRSSASGSRRRVQDDVVSPTLVPGVPEPVQPPNKTSTLMEEIGFFDKVKKAIGSKQSYNEFLKILNLYNQDLIDKKVLVERVEGFIGSHHDLFDWFKTYVGFDHGPLHIENITFKKHQLDLTLCKPYGPSYRKLPKVETYMPCSGRDEMCWEVLNDEWVGHPTWASEDSGFIAHRKNQYEEILHRIEEERHEYDFYMESNLRTIQTLETIANRIANMSPEEKAAFKLPSGLGHTSQTIYKKVVRKIYGKEKGFEVIDALHEHPATAVPIVLKRLKQKDEEWRRAHREWNKIWREMEQKVFFKSLDHLGLTFKQADKKLLTTKQLVSEISTIKSEQTTKRLHPLTPKPQKQLDYDFFDNEILYDIAKFVNVFLNSSSYSANDKERLFDFFKSFLILFFDLPQEAAEEAINKRIFSPQDERPSSSSVAIEAAAATPAPSDSESTPSVNGRKRHRDTDLLKDVLRKSKKTYKDDTPDSTASPSESTPDEPVVEKVEGDVQEQAETAGESWVQTANSEAQTTLVENKERTVFNLFGNTNVYVFFRHLRVLYDRLSEVKAINTEVTADLESRSDVRFAKDLNLVSNQLEEMGLQFSKSDAYAQLLAFSERAIEGDIEHQWFEESLRQAYRNRAYKLYSVEKVVQSLVKHLHSILTDSRSSEILVLFEKNRKEPTTSAKDQIVYRNLVRSNMNPDDNMFRIEFNAPKHHVCIEYVALDDLTLKDQVTDEEKWNYYLTSYVIAHPTEGVNVSEVRMPFLKSQTLEDAEETDLDGYTDSQLRIKVARDNYKLFFESDSHDEFTRFSVYNNVQKETRSHNKVEKLEKIFEEKTAALIGNEEELTDMTEKLKLLSEDPEKFVQEMDEKRERESQKQIADEDQTIDKGDETIADVTAKKVNPAITSVLEQDVTVDADSTIPQDDTELKGNDTTAEEVAITEDSNNTSTVISEQTKATTNTAITSEIDNDGDAKMG